MPTSSEVFNLISSGNKSLNKELGSLTPSAHIYFYEIDLSEVAPTMINYDFNGNQPINKGIFRVYNDYNLYKIANNQYGTIKWQGNFYYPFPIIAEGFDYTTAGALPTPKISISNITPDQSLNSFYRYIRMQMQSLGDVIGAKFTRIKTFLKYLDGSNFSNGINPFNPNTGIYEIELPKDIYYIDRKTVENKNIIEYQLASILDVENLTLPGRTILSIKCPFQYRGEGCVYEYNNRLTYLHSGVYAYTANPPIKISGLQTAPPVATENDQLFVGGVFDTGSAIGKNAILRLTGVSATAGNSGIWLESQSYLAGDFVYIQNRGLKNYYVCNNQHISDIFNAPPNANYWVGDTCSKSLNACRLRWLKNPAFRPVIWPTNRNGENFAECKSRITGLYAKGEQVTLWITGDSNGNPINFPRRPGAEDPSSPRSHGLPKDVNGNYLNGFLPFGGFPGTNQPNA